LAKTLAMERKRTSHMPVVLPIVTAVTGGDLRSESIHVAQLIDFDIVMNARQDTHAARLRIRRGGRRIADRYISILMRQRRREFFQRHAPMRRAPVLELARKCR